jgi:hypothetical protein
LSAALAPRRLAATAAFAVALVLLLAGMGALSAWITRGELIHEASEALATLRSGEPRWHWPLHQRSDLVAKRVFGAADLSVEPDGLRATSRDGTPFELGLPVADPIDLAHWPLLRLNMRSDTAGVLGLVYQAGEFTTACRAEHAAPFTATDTALTVNLQALSWQSEAGGPCQPPGVVSYMLRLQLQAPAQGALTIREVALTSPHSSQLPAKIEADSADLRLPGATVPDGLATLARERSAPLVRLPAHASAETMLSLRDRVMALWPAAIILPYGQSITARHAGHVPGWLDWSILAVYLTGLLWLSLSQKPGVIRPWLEVAGIAVGPLWLIAGLRWGPQISLPAVIAFVAALIYGGQSEWRRRPAPWSWWSKHWTDWLWPLLPLPVAGALTLADGHGLIHLNTAHILAYLGWALLQQWAMLALVMGRLRQTRLPLPVILLITATLFGLLHTPNGSLMQLCLLAEVWWAWRFIRAPRLAPIALAHAASALLVESGLTGHLLRSLEVSARFFL